MSTNFMMVGCQSFDFYAQSLMSPLPEDLEPPRELNMVSLPAYRIEPPDVLQIEVVKLVPRPPYRIEVYDVLMVQVSGTILDAPINSYFLVDEEGMLDLGPPYGQIRITGLTIDEAISVTTQYLQQMLRQPEVTIRLARTGGTQQINGIYLIQQDGIINLRQYGVVQVADKTLVEAREAIEKQLSQYFDFPQVVLDVIGYNSMTYFVIREGTRDGEDVVHLPITGKETVLDAIGRIGGLAHASSKQMWIARPLPGKIGCEQILPVDYMAISRGGSTATNYQLLPGDRLFIAEDGLLTGNYLVQKVALPFYTLLGTTQLAAYTVKSFQIMGRSVASRFFF